MWPFKSKPITWAEFDRKLRRAGLPPDWGKYRDPILIDKYISLFAKTRDKEVFKHIRTLSKQEQKEFSEGKHPSQHHASAEKAKIYAEKLKEELKHLDWVESVSLGYYHLDRLVLNVDLKYDPGYETVSKNLPFSFLGFQTFHGPIGKIAQDQGPKEIM
jgi:hypothetical protein